MTRGICDRCGKELILTEVPSDEEGFFLSERVIDAIDNEIEEFIREPDRLHPAIDEEDHVVDNLIKNKFLQCKEDVLWAISMRLCNECQMSLHRDENSIFATYLSHKPWGVKGKWKGAGWYFWDWAGNRFIGGWDTREELDKHYSLAFRP